MGKEKLICDKFVLYGSFYESVIELPDAEQGIVFRAIFKYAFEGIETELKGIAGAIFRLIMPSLQTQRKNWLNGCKGGRPNRNDNPTNNPNETQTITQIEPNNKAIIKPNTLTQTEPIRDKDKYLSIRDKDLNTKTKDSCPNSETESPHCERFKIFWNHYPKKVGKGKCEDWFKKNKPSAKLLDELIDAIEKQKKSKTWLENNGRFIPMPATWLNQRRWGDELETAESEAIITGYEHKV